MSSLKQQCRSWSLSQWCIEIIGKGSSYYINWDENQGMRRSADDKEEINGNIDQKRYPDYVMDEFWCEIDIRNIEGMQRSRQADNIFPDDQSSHHV